MMARMAIGALFMATSACISVVPADEELPVHGGGGTCDASRAARLVGQEATSALGAEALRLTGASALRWIQPGDMVTMDYRPDRLNVKLDARNRIEQFTCG